MSRNINRVLSGFVVSLLLGNSVALGQQCSVDRDPDHAEWQSSYLGDRVFEKEFEGILRSMGILPSGRISIVTDSVTLAKNVEIFGLDLDAESYVRVVQRVGQHVDNNPKTGGAPGFERFRSLQLGVPDRPLWPDSTVHCLASLINGEDARRWLSEVVSAATDGNLKRILDGQRLRFELWLFIGESGQVWKTELKQGQSVYWDVLGSRLQQVVSAFRFRPASINGVPSAVWVSQWISLRF